MQVFVTRLREAALRDGIPSDRQLALCLGISPSTLSRASRGRVITLSPVLIQRALARYPELASHLLPDPGETVRQVA